MTLEMTMTLGNVITLLTVLVGGIVTWVKTRDKVDQLMSWRDELEEDMKTLSNERARDAQRLSQVIERAADSVTRASTLLDTVERRVTRIEKVMDTKLLGVNHD